MCDWTTQIILKALENFVFSRAAGLLTVPFNSIAGPPRRKIAIRLRWQKRPGATHVSKIHQAKDRRHRRGTDRTRRDHLAAVDGAGRPGRPSPLRAPQPPQ